MKKLALIAALVAAPVLADTWEIPNKNNGKIVLEDYVCTGSNGKRYESLRTMFAVSGDGKTISGCWYVDENWVHVIYKDGSEYTYPAGAFRQNKSYKPKGTST